ncbi:hypothetical protein [Kitasatospora sp. NPDC089509]|uniref:hypothetical protein n=1 Tax=Kitasatospora sp. NPDC089509 TaxID=3364079 RepID=UPI00380E7110
MGATEVDGLGFVGVTIQRGHVRVLCSTTKSEEKVYERGSPPGPETLPTRAHSGLALDTSWGLAYYSQTSVVTELNWTPGEVSGTFWPKNRLYSAFYWSAADKALLAARTDSATIDKYGPPVQETRLLAKPVQHSIGATDKAAFSDLLFDTGAALLFGLQKSTSNILVWGKLQAGSGGSSSSINFGAARWLAIAPTSENTYVLGTPEGSFGTIQRFNADKKQLTPEISIPTGWQCCGRPVIATAENRQYCCIVARKGTGTDLVWGIVVADVQEFTKNTAAVIPLSDAYGVAPLAVNPDTGTLYAIKIFSTSPKQTGLQVVSANPAKPTDTLASITTWHSSLDLHSDTPEHLWCYTWGQTD